MTQTRNESIAVQQEAGGFNLDEKRAIARDLFEDAEAVDRMSEEELDARLADSRRELRKKYAANLERIEQRNKRAVLFANIADYSWGEARYVSDEDVRRAIETLRAEAVANGVAGMSMEEVDQIIAECRQQMRQKNVIK